MVTKHALIRKLPAVETLGSVTYICTDKTGTLTQNKMTVREIWTANPPVAADLKLDPTQLMLLCMIANQDTALDGKGKVTGEPTEIALAAYAAGHDRFETMWHRDFPRVQEIPFDSERKMMTTVHAAGEKFLVVTKGAVEYVRDVCLDVDETVVHQAESYAKQGQRVLVYACKLLDTDPKDTPKESLENDLFCIGMAGLIDPPRPEAAKAVAECRTAGIVPVMITGDHPSTARAIATEIGIIQNAKDRVLNGRELHGMSQDDFEKVVEQIKVYARVTPAQKLRIVKTLQQNGQYVAMTGDGVNDAPALQQADIGVAMGIGGTDVTKEAAHMILLDDNFATIVKAIKEGRRIYDNIRKFIKYIVTSNSGEIWTITIAPLLGMPIPLLPIHILWINLVTDGLPSLALANEPAEPDIMSRPPRPPGESIFANGLGWHTFVFGMLMGAVCLGLQFWAESNHNPHAQTMVFTVLCLSQMGNVMAIRSERYPLYQLGLFTNLPLLGSVLLTFVLQLILIYVPFCHQVFNTQSLTWQEVLLCLGLSSIVFHGVELNKLIRRGKPFELKITKKTAPVL
jgi:Ca2+-transporting ATPase